MKIHDKTILEICGEAAHVIGLRKPITITWFGLKIAAVLLAAFNETLPAITCHNIAPSLAIASPFNGIF